MGYLFLFFTIVAETAAVILMKLSNGTQHKTFLAFAVFTYAASFVFLTLALKTLPAGLANGIWSGASTLLIAGLGVLFFQEKINTIQALSLFLIAIGLVGLNLSKST